METPSPIIRYAGWPAGAVALLERAVTRHGGWDRWERLGSVGLSPVALGGPLPRAKGNGRTFDFPRRVEVFPHALRTVFRDYPAAGGDGVFDRGAVMLAGAAGEPLRSADHRRTFRGLRKYRRWDALDALYFFGYAMANYLSLPFLLAELPLVRFDTRRSYVTVDFPADFPTHCVRQRFWFAPDGLLTRHDYTAEVVGSWAAGAHFSNDYVHIDDMPFATARRVVARLGTLPLPVPVLTARLEDFAITLR